MRWMPCNGSGVRLIDMLAHMLCLFYFCARNRLAAEWLPWAFFLFSCRNNPNLALVLQHDWCVFWWYGGAIYTSDYTLWHIAHDSLC